MRIAVVDDTPILLEYLEKNLRTAFLKYESTVEIVGFQRPDAFLQAYEKNLFHVVFLDIYLPRTSGFEVAKMLREKDKNILIIFCTSDDSMVYDAIKYNPLRFLRKSRIDEELDETVDAVISEMEKSQYKLVAKAADGIISIPAKEIIYIESQGHYLNVYMESEMFTYKGKINDCEVDLSHLGFIRTHVGFLVNAMYIYKIGGTEVILSNGIKIPMSRQRVSDVRNKFWGNFKNTT